jgi:DNA-binding IclR family transcriptional regulator
MKVQRPSGETLGTVQRILEIMRFFAQRGEATLKDLSSALGLAPSTCHRLLELLSRDGFIAHDPVRRRYRIGTEYFRIAALVQSKHDVCQISRPFLRRAVDACDETCVLTLYSPTEGKIFFAEKVDSSRMLRYQLPMNTPLSVLWGASGRSILAFLEPAEIARIYADEGRAPASGEALPSRTALEREIKRIRELGYAVSHGQKILGAVGISAPVFQVEGKVIGNISITVPESRMMKRDEKRLGELIRSIAEELSVALGAPSPAYSKASA